MGYARSSASSRVVVPGSPGLEQVMENSTPLTRCDTCHTVFEVPLEILDSVDSRVRCGECLQVFDASINLHTASRPDFSLVDDTLVDGAVEPGSSNSASRADSTDQFQTEFAAAGLPAAANARKAVTPSADNMPGKSQSNPSDGIVSGRINSVASALHDDTADESHLEATMSDFDLFSDDASLPEVSYEFGENTIDAIQLEFDSVEDVADETLSDSLFPNEVTIDATGFNADADVAPVLVDSAISPTVKTEVKNNSGEESEADIDEVIRRSAKTDFVVEEGPKPETIEFDYRDTTDESVAPATGLPVAGVEKSTANPALMAGSSTDRQLAPDPESANPVVPETGGSNSKPSRVGRYVFHASLLLLTVVLVAALYGYRERNNLVDNPLTRPFYSAWCGIKGCAVPARLDKSQLKVVEKNIFSHPTLDDALVITVLLENNADFEQRYPALFLWLSDSARRTVAANEFEPAVYLPENGLTVESVLMPGQQRRISIDVRDPGRRAVSLELSLR